MVSGTKQGAIVPENVSGGMPRRMATAAVTIGSHDGMSAPAAATAAGVSI